MPRSIRALTVASKKKNVHEQVTCTDLAPLSIGLAMTRRRVQNRQAWSTLVGTTTSSTGQATGR